MRGVIASGCFILLLIAMPIAAQQNTPQPLAYGQTVTGDLNTQRIEALYIFAGQQGDAITITMDSTAGTLDPLLILVDQSQQTVLAVDNNSGGDQNARLRYIIPATANYMIRVTAIQGSSEISGTYRLSLTLNNPMPTPSPDSNAPVIAPFLPDETMQGELNDTVNFRLYTLRAKQGDPIWVTLQVSDSLRAGMYLYGADFREITRAERGGELNLKAPADGLYFLMVAREASTGAGKFTLRKGTVNDPAGIPISIGKTVRGSISAGSAVKIYQLQAHAGETLVARLHRLSGDLSGYVYISAADGNILAESRSANEANTQLTLTFPADGTYTVTATREGQQSGTTTGDYLLTITLPGDLPTVPDSFRSYTRMDYGDKVSGTIDNTGFAVPYYFAAETGDTLQAVMTTANSLDSYLILQNASGDTIAEDDNSAGQSNAQIAMTIPQTGYYTLIATRADFANGTTTGSFTLSLDFPDPLQAQPSISSIEGVTLVAGQAQTGSIGAQIGGFFRFDAQQNTAVDINVNPMAGLDVVTLLTDSNFQEVSKALVGPIRTVLLPDAGTYFVFVLRANGPLGPVIGDYSIMLHGTINPAPTPAPVVLISGQSVNGNISRDNYQVRYFVNAHQDMTLTVSMDAATGSTLDPMVALLDSKNNLLAVNDDAVIGLKNAALSYTISADGQYTVVATRAQEAAGTTTGAYTLKVEETQAPPATPQLATINAGDSVDGTITGRNILYYYTFQGKAGDVITITMRHNPGSTLDPLLYLYAYSSQPQLLATNNDAEPENPDAAIASFKLPQSGPYLIVATRMDVAKGNTEGSFVLSLTKER
jgi:hypothetical protein